MVFDYLKLSSGTYKLIQMIHIFIYIKKFYNYAYITSFLLIFSFALRKVESVISRYFDIAKIFKFYTKVFEFYD